MTSSELWKLVITSFVGMLVGGCGVGFFISRLIGKKLDAAEAVKAKRKEMAQEKRELDQEFDSAVCKAFFWVAKQLLQAGYEEDLKKSIQTISEIEDKKKRREREIIAEYDV